MYAMHSTEFSGTVARSRFTRWVLALVLVAAFVLPWAAQGALTVRYVQPKAVGGNGTTWTLAASNIWDAVTNAYAADQAGPWYVYVSNGVYEATNEMVIGPNTTIYGTNQTSIAAAQTGVIVAATGPWRAFNLQSSSARIACLTVSNKTTGLGGGVTVSAGIVSNCTVARCVWTNGGGVFLEGPSSVMYNGYVTNCLAQSNGGGIYAGNGATISNVNVTACTATNHGGGLFISNAWVYGSSVQSNRSVLGWGGGVFVHEAGGMITGATFRLNTATNGFGGGVYAAGGHLRMLTVQNNTARDGGGLYISNAASFLVGAPLLPVTANVAMRDGGGMYVLMENAVLTNWNFSANTASNGGGGLFLYTNAFVYNGGSSGNTARVFGGGVYQNGGMITNFVAEKNFATNGVGIYMQDGTVVGSQIRFNNGIGGGPLLGAGGGVYIFKGSLSNSVVLGNAATNGGGVYLATEFAQVYGVTILSNRATRSGGGVYSATGDVCNTLIAANAASNGGGAFIIGDLSHRASIRSCTIAGNAATNGGGLYCSTGAVVNTIIYNNNMGSGLNPFDLGRGYGTSPDITNVVAAPSDNDYTYTCSLDVPAGTGNFVDNPRFVAREFGDYQLSADSPCRDVGFDEAWMTGAYDVRGGNRENGTVDLGAYENGGDLGGPLTVGMIGTNAIGGQLVTWLYPTSGLVFFNANVAGSNTASVTYYWDFDTNGTPDATGEYVSWWYTNDLWAGSNSVRVTAVNGIGEISSRVFTNYILVAKYFVVPANLFPVPPYRSLATAATNLADALTWAIQDGAEIQIAAGSYTLPGEVIVNKGAWVHGVAGPDATVLARATANAAHRCLWVSHTNANIDGLTISNGWAALASRLGSGGGVYLQTGIVQNCRIVNNVATNQGGGVYVSTNGILRNSFIFGNVATNGGGVYLTPTGLVQSCTIVSNRAMRAGGGLFCLTGRVENTIIYFNSTNNRGRTATDWNGVGWQGSADVTNVQVYAGLGGVFSNCCTPPAALLPGSGNISADPAFLDRYGNDYRLGAGSSCTNVGTNQTWMIGATDVRGNLRIQDSWVDVGAYEGGGPLSGGFAGTNTVGNQTVNWLSTTSAWIFFTAYANGTNTSSLAYAWDFDNNGTTDAVGQTASWAYTNDVGGYFSVRLVVTNGAGEVATLIRPNYVFVSRYYVVPDNATPVFPYQSWTTAATNLNDAVYAADWGGSEIRMSAGVHPLTSEVAVVKPLWIHGVSTPEKTVVRGWRTGVTGFRCFKLRHPNALLEGLTVSNGFAATMTDFAGSGGGVYLQTGLVANCIIVNNQATNHGGGVFVASNTVLRNSLVYGNIATNGGGVFVGTGLVQNCTIVSNMANLAGGGIFSVTGRVENTIIAGNWTNGNYGIVATWNRPGLLHDQTRDVSNMVVAGYSGSFSNSCTPQAGTAQIPGSGNIIGPPAFVSPLTRDFRLSGGTCVDAGTNRTSWMIGETDLSRVVPRVVTSADGTKFNCDIGAYESGPLQAGFTVTNALGNQLATWVSPTSSVMFFTAFGVGTNAGTLTYAWDFNGDGLADANTQIATYEFANSEGGYRAVRLVISNNAPVPETSTVTLSSVFVAKHFVAQVNPNPVAPYYTWATAATNIQDALNYVLPNGSQIVVSNGTYNVLSQLAVTNGTWIRSVNGAGSTFARGRYPAFTNRVVYMAHSNAVVQGLTITNGTDGLGGGMLVFSGRVDTCVVAGNVATNGGGIYLFGHGIVRNSTVAGNYAYGSGGGMYCTNWGGVTNVSIVDNSAAALGGGVFIGKAPDTAYRGATNVMEGCQILRNHSDGIGGGGVYMMGGTLTNCLVQENWAATNGGGIFAAWPTAWIIGGTVTVNTAVNGGGIYATNWGVIDSVTIAGNTATNLGGGIRSDGPWVTAGLLGGGLFGCTITGNVAVSGGGAFLDRVRATNNLVIANVATNGGGVYLGTNVMWVGGDVTGNWASLRGGGMYLKNTNTAAGAALIQVVSNTAITANQADYGGGIYNAATSIFGHIHTCVIGFNQSRYDGGGVYMYGGWFTNCTFKYNTAVGDGGGVYQAGGSIWNCTNTENNANNGGGMAIITNLACMYGRIEGNDAVNNGGGVYGTNWGFLTSVALASNVAGFNGGGLYCDSGMAVRTCSVATNIAYNNGGGAYCGGDMSTGYLFQCYFYSNAATAGGGVYIVAAAAYNCAVVSNQALNGGGLFMESSAKWIGGGITGNLANGIGSSGGGVYMQGGVFAPTINGSVTGNVASLGGGIFLESGVLSNNCTIAGNTAYERGGGVFLAGGTLTNVNILLNTAQDGGGLYISSLLLGATTQSAIRVVWNYAQRNGGGVCAEGVPYYTLLNGASLVASNYAGEKGGGVYFDGALGLDTPTLTISNSVPISRNVATNKGGGVYAQGQAYLDSWLVTNNHSRDLGGGIYLADANASASMCRVVWNFATNSGGGLFLENGSVTGGYYQANSASNGAGIYMIGGSLAGGTSVQNLAVSGGGLFVDGAGAVFGTLITGNVATVGGGLFMSNVTAETTVDGLRIHVNTATNGGGGIYLPAGQDGAHIVNSDIRANITLGHGGGIYQAGGHITNCSVRANTAWYGYGGGLYRNGWTGALDGIILWENSASNGGGAYLTNAYLGSVSIFSNRATRTGGGLFVDADAWADNCTVYTNIGVGRGGGVFLRGGAITNFTIVGNVSTNGGGVFVSSVVARVDGGYVASNVATVAGGGIFAAAGFITNTIVQTNTALNGGGMFVYSTDVTANGVTLTQNLARLAGGGLYVATGLVESCTIVGNVASNDGGGVHLWYGTLRSSTVAGNIASNRGGGVWVGANSLLESSTVAGNLARADGGGAVCSGAVSRTRLTANRTELASGRGGGVMTMGTGSVYSSIMDLNSSTNGGGAYVLTGGRIQNCTVVDNWSTNGAVHNSAGLVANTIMYYNHGSVSAPLDNNWKVSGGTANYSFSNCCSYPVTTGVAARVTGNIGSAPLLMSDFTLSSGSPCTNAGVNQDWMVGAFDFAGAPRIDQDTEIVDIGAYEGAQANQLTVNIVVDKTAGSVDMDRNRFQFTAIVSGPDLAGLNYTWDFDNDGNADASGTDRQVVTNIYSTSGTKLVNVVVTNAALAAATNLWTGNITIATYYVVAANNSAGTYPYTSWATAASNLVTVMQAAEDGTVIIVSNGTYMAYGSPITLDRSLYIWATNGAYSTEITNVVIAAPNSVLDGFKISGRRTTLGALAQAVDVRAENVMLKNCFMERADRYVTVQSGLARNFRMDGCIGRFAYTNGVDVQANVGVRIVSNMFQRFAFTTDGVDDFVAEYNTIIGRSVDGRVTRPVQFTNVTGTVEVRNNNFLYQTNIPVMSYFGGTLDVTATNNWWGTVDGPRDEVGATEMAAADPETPTADMKNDTPGTTLGGTVAGLAGGVTNYFGSDSIDYHPWATAPFASQFPLPPGKIYVDETWYGELQPNEGHTWQYDAWTNLQQAVNSNMFWDGGCEGLIRLHIPQLHSTLEGALAEANASIWPEEVTYEVFMTNMVYPAAGPAYVYSSIEWTPSRKGTAIIGRPETNITLVGGWWFVGSFITLDGFNCVTGGPTYFLRPAGTNVTLRNCRFTRSNKRTFESAPGCHNFRSENCYYDGSTAGNYINPGMDNCVWVSNYFDGTGIGFDLSDNIQFYYNTFVRASVSFSAFDGSGAYTNMSILQNPPGWPPGAKPNGYRHRVIHNNFFGHLPTTPAVSIAAYYMYNNIPGLVTNIQDRFSVYAVSNYWGNTNGPLDELGDQEVNVDTALPGPGMTNLLNASPNQDTFDIGGWARGFIQTNTTSLEFPLYGSSNIDYFPWSQATITNGWPQTFSPNVVFVNTNYYSDGPHNDPSGSPEIFPTLWNGQPVSYEWGVNAFSNIQTAVDMVFQGGGYVYLATQRFDIASPITLSGRINLIGSAAWTGGWSTIHMDYPNAVGRCINVANSFATLQYLTITNGHALGAGQAGQGGGVRLSAIPSIPWQGYPIRYCQIVGNVAEGAGGGVYFESGGSAYGPRLQGSTISGNQAWEGGGIYSVKSIFPTACVIENNAATNGNGGGIFCGSGTASAAYGLNAIIRNNTATGDGGGVYSSNNTHIAWTISGNSAASNGGGAFLYAGGLQSSVVDGNAAGIAGGGVFGQTNGPAVTMNSATVMCNSAASGGGVRGWLITLQNLTQIYSNRATGVLGGGGVHASNLTASAGVRICTNFAEVGSGGGVYATIAALTQVTNIGNYAAQTGGAVFVDRNLTLATCDVIENTSSNGGGAFAGLSLAASAGNYLRNVSRGNGGAISSLGSASTVSGAYLQDNAAESHGGAAYLAATNGIVINCQVLDNVAQTNGGGVWLQRGTVSASTFSGNTASNSGGGAYVQAAGVTGCTFAANSASNAGAGLYYVAMEFINSTGTVSACSFSANVGLGDGAGAYVVSGVVQGCSFSDNTTYGRGGGAYLLDAVATNALASGNTAGDGGGFYVTGLGAILTNCTISVNTANTNGGGVLLADGANARGCLVKGNTAAGIGGGVYVSSATNENFTVYGNTADTGAGIGQLDGLTRNALVIGNTDTGTPTTPEWNRTAGTVEYSYGPVKADLQTWGSGNIGADVEVGQPMLDPANDNFKLLSSGPCDDAGSTQSWMTNAKDINGSNRVMNAVVDIGAYEGTYAVKTLYVVDSNDNPTAPYDSWDTAGLNITQVLNAADSGDIVVVSNGTFNVAAAYTISKAITLKSTNGCDVTAITVPAGIVVGASGVRIEGFRLDGTKKVKGQLTQVLTVNSGVENVQVVSNIIENADRYIRAPGANRLTVDANVCRFAWYRGIDLSGGRHTVTRNMFQKHGISGYSLGGLTAEWNLFIGHDADLANARMLEFSNITAQVIVRNNNIMFNDDVGILHGGGSADILATNNWWGTDNGPRDDSGVTEMTAGSSDTTTADLQNALPADALGPIVAQPDRTQTGSSHIDYFPWAHTSLALPPMLSAMPSNQVWVSWSNQVYQALGYPNPAYGTAFGVDAFTNIGGAINAHMYWDGGCRMEYLLHIPWQYPYTNIQDGLNGGIANTASNGLQLFTTLIISTNTLGDGSYTRVGGGYWNVNVPGITLIAEPTTQVVVRGGFNLINVSTSTLAGLIIENGVPHGITVNTGVSGQNTIRDCRFRNVAGSVLISFSGPGGAYRGTFDFLHNYIESGGGFSMQPGWWYTRILSNYFGQGAVGITDQEGVHVEYNTFDNGCSMSVNTYNPMSTSRSTWTNYVCNNNFVGITSSDPALTVDWYNNTGPYDLSYGIVTVIATNNWWGSPNGPYDPRGDVGGSEVDVTSWSPLTFTPHPGIRGLSNSVPASPDIGGALYRRSRAPNLPAEPGVDNVDYLPWATNFVMTFNDWGTNSSAREVWVDTAYRAPFYGGSNGNWFPGDQEYRWGYNAFSNIGDAVRSVNQANGTVWISPEDQHQLTEEVVISGVIRLIGTNGSPNTGRALVYMKPGVNQRCFKIDNSLAWMRYMVISNGYASGTGTDGCGGGVYINQTGGHPGSFASTPWYLFECDVVSNRAAVNGGGVYVSSVATYSPRLYNTLIARNEAGVSGGGVYSELNVYPLGCTIEDNVALTGNGGGLYTVSSEVPPTGGDWRPYGTNALVRNNTAAGSGGGLYALVSYNTYWTLHGNSALGDGGGACVLDGAPSNWVVYGNSAYTNGGGLYLASALAGNMDVAANSARFGAGVYASNCTMVSMTITNHVAPTNGGAIFAVNGLTLVNSLLSNNVAGSGGAIYADTDPTVGAMALTITNTIITMNWATNGDGGGICAAVSTIPTSYRLTLRETPVVWNWASNGMGGGVYAASNVTAIGLAISSNFAGLSGGGLYAGGSVAMSNVTIVANRSTNGQGGGVWAGFDAGVSNSWLLANFSRLDGGAVYAGRAVTLRSTPVVNNTATNGSGGGVYAGDDLLATSMTMSTNYAGVAGGAAYAGGNAGLTSVRVAINAATNGAGGGLYVAGAAGLTNATVVANQSTGPGGGLYAGNGGWLIGTPVSANSALSGAGGGVYAAAGQFLARDLGMTNNVAAGSGGGAWVASGGMTNMTFAINTSRDSGGGLYMLGGGITNLTFIGNVASNQGGGLYGESLSVAWRNEFLGNTAGTNGGGAAIFGGTMSTGNIRRGLSAIVSNNTASGGSGGGLYVSNVFASHVRVWNNTSKYTGGGVAMTNGSVLRNALVYGNTATFVTSEGGGVYSVDSTNESCTIANNTAASGGGVASYGSSRTLNSVVFYNLADDWLRSAGTVDYTLSPVDMSLWGTGNVTTNNAKFVDEAARDYRLRTNSSMCVDSGLTQPWMTGIYDILGSNRVQGVSVDRGAIEGGIYVFEAVTALKGSLWRIW